MSLFDEARFHGSGGPKPEIETEDELERRMKEEKLVQYADARLKALVSDEDMYYAMENFLLADPERQIPLLGDMESLISKGDEAKSTGSKVIARTNYETAAKIEIYKQNKEGAKRCLGLAQQVTDEGDKHLDYQRKLMENLDEVLRVSKAYYETVTKA